MAPFNVNLDNCDQEPIHIPGLIQSHGALLAFDFKGRLRYFSQEAEQLLGSLPAVQEDLQRHHLSMAASASDLIATYIKEAKSGDAIALTYEIKISDNRLYDLVLHSYNDLIVAEFEQRDHDNDSFISFPITSQKAINAIRQQKTLPAMFETIVCQIRNLTGFDRVMAYHFKRDGSGEVIAECLHENLDPYSGRYYPATDIPAQARRLYCLNTLRLIRDSYSMPVPVIAADFKAPPLDMTHCVLRSVSPIHIEYLHNMGVAASMSISVVINDKLWGLIACHHRTAYHVPYSVRMGCEVICQILSSKIHQLEMKEITERQAGVSTALTHLALKIANADDFATALLDSTQALNAIVPYDAIMLTYGARHVMVGIDSTELLMNLLQWLGGLGKDWIKLFERSEAPTDIADLMGDFCGLLAMSIDLVNKCWIIFLRKEKIKTITWSGDSRHYEHGKFGARLTPPGSFETWKETVRGKAEPWTEADCAIARQMHAELIKIFNSKNAAINQVKTKLMAMLGHDLRDPLNSINIAAQMLDIGKVSPQVSDRILKSSSRMQRLITDVMDVSKLQNGLPIVLRLDKMSLKKLVEQIIDESRTGYPDVKIDFYTTCEGMINGDADRLFQAIGNLISNARHHGDVGYPISIHLSEDESGIILNIANKGREIPQELQKILFTPFKAGSANAQRRSSGLGFGLYICFAIVENHQGHLSYCYQTQSSEVIFTIRLPKFST